MEHPDLEAIGTDLEPFFALRDALDAIAVAAVGDWDVARDPDHLVTGAITAALAFDPNHPIHDIGLSLLAAINDLLGHVRGEGHPAMVSRSRQRVAVLLGALFTAARQA